jgi:hypothetical protein
MNAMARGKRDMFDAFVNKELREGSSWNLSLLPKEFKPTFLELEKLLKGCIPDVHDDTKPAPPCNKPKKHKKPVVVDDELPFVSEPDTSIFPSDPDTSQFQSEPDIGTSDGEGLSDGPTSNMSDGHYPEGKPYVLHVEAKC